MVISLMGNNGKKITITKPVISTFNLRVHHAQQSHKTQIIFNSSVIFSIRDLAPCFFWPHTSLLSNKRQCQYIIWIGRTELSSTMLQHFLSSLIFRRAVPPIEKKTSAPKGDREREREFALVWENLPALRLDEGKHPGWCGLFIRTYRENMNRLETNYRYISYFLLYGNAHNCKHYCVSILVCFCMIGCIEFIVLL